MPRHTFPKCEHLTGEMRIASLFREGESFFVYPWRIVWRAVPVSDVPVRWMIVTPKRNLRHAVLRNLVKRRCREAYRLSKAPLVEAVAASGFSLEVAYYYVDREAMPFSKVSARMQKSLDRLIRLFGESLNPPA